MEVTRGRARELLPQVVLTVLSIIQALALEVLWSSVHASEHLWNGGFAAWLGWLQVFAVFLGLLVMWIFYLSLVLRYRWTPTVQDSVVPFLLGVLEFSLAEMLAPELLHLWLYVLAALFIGASATSVVIIRRAIADEANAEVIVDFDLSMPTAIFHAATLTGTLVVAGVAVQWAGPDGWVALAAVLAAISVLAIQGGIIRHHWNRVLHRRQ
ncbi:MAG: hypothetical protein ACQGVK_08450 [Myxococcota bacterium]